MDLPLLEARALVKSFSGVRALKGVSLSLRRGEVLAVIGENGAGKSTLMKILAGVEFADTGEIRIDGRTATIGSVHDALARGIALIHQELNLADNLDVAANIFLGREKLRFGLIDKARQRREARPLLDAVGLDTDPSVLVSSLSIGQQQLVEIAKALSVEARVLIMDEPTSSLSSQESRNLCRVIGDLRARGVSVVYISHRLSEVRALADRVTVLRDGANAGDLARDEITHDTMVQHMVGRDSSQFYPYEPRPPGAPVLEVAELRTPAHPMQRLSFTVHAGEIVGIAGLIGAGRTELLTTLFGVTPALGGSIRIAGIAVAPRSPRAAIAAGIALVPEDRKKQGVVLEMSVRDNLSLASLRRDQRHGLINRQRAGELGAEMIAALKIKTSDSRQPVQFLSGGNQQKVVIGKWLALRPRVLLLDEPTRGIDIGAKQEVYRLLEQLAREGVAVLYASSEMEEILGVSDRVLVMHEGRIAGELPRSELTEESIMHLATGSRVTTA